MAILKCKMCGDNIEVSADKTYGTCDSCGSTMTLPKIDSGQRVNLYNRANHFRRQNEFDKALAIYERMIGEDDSEAEAHWGAVLCRFGIEYVVDPASGNRVPTCHRASLESILNDVDYQAALDYTDDNRTKNLYKEEATYISEVQREILAISQKEEPYDIFICYKETDANGNRAQDSALAQDVYYQLTQEGYKVFFSRITLEDKLGQAYEPYIFAALNSAKVMVVIGTKSEYYNAVWVKNEWSRYLARMKKDKSLLLIPCYRDMDAYDIPEELAMLQSQDMSKIGFVQDLIRGIKKVLIKEESPVTKVVETVKVENGYSANVESPLKRVKLFLEDGEWDMAESYCEKVLDLDAECAMAYVYHLCAGLKCKSVESLALQNTRFLLYKDYKKAIRFGTEALKVQLEGYDKTIADRVKENNRASVYGNGLQLKKTAKYQQAIEKFQSIADYKDAKDQISECEEGIYQSGLASKEETDYQRAIEEFQSIADYKDSKEQIVDCNRLVELVAQETAKADAEAIRLAEQQRLQVERDTAIAKVKMKKSAIIGGAFCTVLAIGFVVYTLVISPLMTYNNAVKLRNTENYEKSIEIFLSLGDYKDSMEQIPAIYYEQAVALREAGSYDEAVLAFAEAGDYSDSTEQMAVTYYEQAVALREVGSYNKAILAFAEAGDYSDSTEQMAVTYYEQAVALREAGSYDEAALAFAEAGDYSDSTEQMVTTYYAQAVVFGNSGAYPQAIDMFTALDDYEDSKNQYEALKIRWMEECAETISAGSNHTVGLKVDGTVVAVGSNDDGQCDVSDWTDIVAISAGDDYTVGLKADGTVVAVGSNDDGQCDVSNWTDIVAIFASNFHTVGLKVDGTVVAVGYNTSGQCDVSNWTNIVAVSVGTQYTVGLKADGTVVAVGFNGDGQCDVSNWTDIVAIAAGSSHTVGLKADGTVVAVGSNTYGQCDVSSWTNIVSISASIHTVGLKADGTVVAVGFNDDGRCDVSNWTNIVSISASIHTVGLKADGAAVAVGRDGDGQCNVSDWANIIIYDN